jgi:hypothetical protein
MKSGKQLRKAGPGGWRQSRKLAATQAPTNRRAKLRRSGKSDCRWGLSVYRPAEGGLKFCSCQDDHGKHHDQSENNEEDILPIDALLLLYGLDSFGNAANSR